MSSPALSLVARIRIYLTLALQAFPLIGVAVLATESLDLNIVIIMGPLLLVIVGLIL
ncbi:MAG: hypothetical protein RLZZ129_359 [Verrucomicrobiota bacterium]|jgi:hypothetical protein